MGGERLLSQGELLKIFNEAVSSSWILVDFKTLFKLSLFTFPCKKF